MFVNLEKKLTNATDERVQAPGKFQEITEIKQLLQHNSNEEREVLRAFGLDNNIRKIETLRGVSIELTKLREEWGNAYKVDDIKRLAIVYRLRFLPLEKYNGAIDPMLAVKMLAFGKKHNVEIRGSSGSGSFNVLAPAEDFNLITHNYERPTLSLDPLLFYKLPKSNFHTLVHKWGSTFTILRWLFAYPFRSKTHMLRFNIITSLLVFGILIYKWFNWIALQRTDYMGNHEYHSGQPHSAWFWFFWLIVAGGLTALYSSAVTANVGYKFWWWKIGARRNDAYYSDEAWDKGYKNRYS